MRGIWGGTGLRAGARACGVRAKKEVIVGWPAEVFVWGSLLLIVKGVGSEIGGALVAGVGGFGVVAGCLFIEGGGSVSGVDVLFSQVRRADASAEGRLIQYPRRRRWR